jgi:hypothetical protein
MPVVLVAWSSRQENFANMKKIKAGIVVQYHIAMTAELTLELLWFIILLLI